MSGRVKLFELSGTAKFGFDPLWVHMWAKWSEQFYENLFLKINNKNDLYDAYGEKLAEYRKSNAPGELLYALRYFFHYRYAEIKDARPNAAHA